MRQKKILWWILSCVLLVVIFVALYMIAEQVQKRANERKSKPATTIQEEKEPFLNREEMTQGTLAWGGQKYDYYHEIETYLFIGTDASGNEDAPQEEYLGNMADFLMLLMVDKTDNRYGVLQLNRDTMTEVTLMQKDGSGMASADIQLCTAHWYGGNQQQSSENTVEAVSKLLGGLKIDGYYTLNMDMIPQINDMVGGVSVHIEDDFSQVDKSLRQGETITLTNEQAYTFIHDRYDVGDETNISRMKRQRQYMENLFGKVQEKTKEDMQFGVKMFQAFQEDAVTNISARMISGLMKQINQSKNLGIYQLEGESKNGKALGDGKVHSEFHVEKKSLIEVMTSLYGLKASAKE